MPGKLVSGIVVGSGPPTSRARFSQSPAATAAMPRTPVATKGHHRLLAGTPAGACAPDRSSSSTFRHETVTPLGDGLDIPRVFGLVAESFSELGDETRHRVLRDERVPPHGVEKRLLFDQTASILDEETKKLVALGLQMEKAIVFPDSLGARIDTNVIESIDAPVRLRWDVLARHGLPPKLGQ
jgi:hypothetical protein